MDILAGTSIQDKYKIESLLGEGSSSFVYKAIDLDLNKPMALKFLKPELSELPSFRSRFLREAKLLAQIHHPNVVTIRAISEWNKYLFIVMDYHGDQSLKDLLAKRKLKRIEIEILSHQLLDALATIHQLQLVHGDIKPANIMIHNEKEAISLTLIDFGLGTNKHQHKTETNNISGTPYYMAPEQILGTASNEKSDLYSAAVCIYQMITSRLPFQDKQEQSFLARVLQEDIPLASHFRKIPMRIDKVLEKALSIAPEDRYPTAESFQKALDLAWKSKIYRGLLPLLFIIFLMSTGYYIHYRYIKPPLEKHWYSKAENYLKNHDFEEAYKLAITTIKKYPQQKDQNWLMITFFSERAQQEYTKAYKILWRCLWYECCLLLKENNWNAIMKLLEKYQAHASEEIAVNMIYSTLCLLLYQQLIQINDAQLPQKQKYKKILEKYISY